MDNSLFNKLLEEIAQSLQKKDMSEKIKFEDIPEAIEKIQSDIAEIRRSFTAINPGKPTNRLFRVPETADFLGLSVASVYRIASEGSIPKHKQGGVLYFLESELIEWIQKGNR